MDRAWNRDQFLDPPDLIIEMTIIRSSRIDASDRMHDGRVVSTTEVAADLTQAEPRVLSSEIHSDLPWQRDGFVASLGKQIGDPQTVVVADGIEDVLDGRRTSGCADFLFTDRLLAEIKVDRPLLEKSQALKLGDGTLELPDVRIES